MKRIIIFTFIFLFALGLRLYKLGQTPPGLTWDETALGYNAYSILKTGKDEFGINFPIIFKSFGDYKPGLYVYLAVPSIAAFGLNEFAVRFPSALFGALAVIGIGLLTGVLFPKQKTVSYISALVLAVMPWHLHFSRGAWEVNLFVTILLFAIDAYLYSLKNRRLSPLLPLFLFSVTFFTYQAAKILTPLVFLLLLSLNWQESRALISRVLKKEIFLLPLYALFIVFVGLYLVKTATGPVGNRVSRLSIFQYRPQPSPELVKIDNSNLTSIRLFHSQMDLTLRAIASRYLYHFSPEILFKENSTPRESLPKMGLLYLVDAAWLFAGLIYLARHTETKKQLLIIGLLLASPLGASLTLSEYSTVRSLFIVIPFALIISLGGYFMLVKHRPLFVIILALYLFNVTLGLDIYFHHSDAFFAPGFNDGYKQAIDRIKDHPSQKVYFTDVYGQPYIYYLFYTKYDPVRYQKNNQFVSGGVDVGTVGRVDSVEFHQFSVDDINTQKDTLFIGTIGNIPDTFDMNSPLIEYSDQINYPDGRPIFRVIKTKP